MRLRSLEMQGFKSFPDRTKLTFDDGITAVVGPNGSGKSNIGDAMRWVLGEQSTKTLRGGKMEDVIFGGTQTRRAQGYAQVQLTIDNSDRALPIDSDAVTVMRKLYRSGESEYLLNNVSVRLKDVYELFMDTGLGRDGYSIIGQGKIAEIVSAKSAQRREIFEEAAGISKYRYRKLEAQRRLEGAEENLLRLKDILLELEGRVEPLRIQSEKAAKFLAMSSEKKQLEISIWVQTLEKSKALLREQEDSLLASKNSHDEIQGELDEIELAINALYTDMQAIGVQMDECRTASRELEEKASKSGADIAVMHNDIAHNDASIERVRAEIEQSGASDREISAKIATYEADISVKELELDELRGQYADVQGRLAEILALQNDEHSRVDALKECRFGLTQSIHEVSLSSASSSSLIEETITRLESLRDGSSEKDENLSRVERERSECAELLETIGENIGSLQNSLEGYRLRKASRADKLAKLEQSRRTLEDRSRGLRQKSQMLTDMENNLEGFAQSVRFIMSRAGKGAISGVFGPVSRLISVEDRYALAIEIALGAGMQNLVVRDETVAKRAINMLKDEKAGRATFLPISTIKGSRLTDDWLRSEDGFVGLAAELVSADAQFSGVVNQLLGRIVIVRDLDAASAIAKKGSYRFRVVTLDGQVVNTGGSMTGGYAAKSAGILSRSREIEELKKQADTLDLEISEHAALEKTAREELSAVDAEIGGIEGELLAAQEDKIRADAEHRQLELAYAAALRGVEQSKGEYEALTARLEELKSRNVSGAELEADLNSQLEKVAAELSELTTGRDEHTRQSAEITTQLSERNVEIITLDKEIEALRQFAAQLSEQKSHQTEHADEQSRLMAQYAEDNERIRQKISDSEAEKLELSSKVQELEERGRELTLRRNECEAAATAKRAGEKEITARREAAARELARLEEKKTAMQSEYDGIISRLWDEYELTRGEALEQAQPVEDSTAAARRLTELKNSIKSLGNVNVGAVEEYREVSERYTFLKSQTDDVIKSRDEIRELIDRLTGDMQSIFTDNFKRIGENFSKIFIELFGGGKAELTLTDPQNVLDSGIDIFVQPPGKIIKNLASLSGGEQSFVAIAIYFAILKVRPSPFCLLDEIEAALDDVNVVKYAQYLRTICKKTQFIAITHRRGTMEEADVLYGVTMQEEGVSKLLELHVSELESKLGMK